MKWEQVLVDTIKKSPPLSKQSDYSDLNSESFKHMTRYIISLNKSGEIDNKATQQFLISTFIIFLENEIEGKMGKIIDGLSAFPFFLEKRNKW